MKNKKIIILIIILAVVIITQIILNIVIPKNKVLIASYVKTLEKDDITKNLPCDITRNGNKIPYFKVANNLYNSINDEILENSLLRSCYQNGYIDYDVSLNSNILSLILYISYETIDDLANIEYKTYNIDIKNNVMINNQELLNKYNLTIDEVNNKVLNYLQEYYNYEKENNLVDSDTTFNDYLNILDYKTTTFNNLVLYIDSKNHLYIYKEYELSEGMRRVDYFKNLTNLFKLK
ncbi:MAG: hypothetical protein MR266_01795 [Erysipelotrichaceae bacterium]|nr:hypothetical protein [Erysipelotrichaceae bacterium]